MEKDTARLRDGDADGPLKVRLAYGVGKVLPLRLERSGRISPAGGNSLQE